MAYNKVVYDGNILIDLTDLDVTAGDVVSGVTFIMADGTKAVGTITIPTKTSDLINDSGFISSENVKDYVTTTGSDGIWKYRKWSSGRIECWGEKSWSSVACTTSMAGGYRSGDVTQALPSGLFTAIDSCQATMKGSGGSGYTLTLRTLCTETTVTQMFWNSSSATKTTLTVDYYIIGS